MSRLYTPTKMKHDLGEQAAKFAGGVLDGYSRDAAEHTCATILQSGGHARAFPADVRDESEVARLVQEVNEAFGAVDILVVNATGSQPLFSIEEQTWQRCLDQLEFF